VPQARAHFPGIEQGWECAPQNKRWLQQGREQLFTSQGLQLVHSMWALVRGLSLPGQQPASPSPPGDRGFSDPFSCAFDRIENITCSRSHS
jgi:hypothetical protein